MKFNIFCFSNETALYLAVKKNNVKIVKLLLSHSYIDVNILNIHYIKKNGPYMQTALHLAVQQQNVDIIKLLLDCENIDTEVNDENGKKPIDYATDEKILLLFKK